MGYETLYIYSTKHMYLSRYVLHWMHGGMKALWCIQQSLVYVFDAQTGTRPLQKERKNIYVILRPSHLTLP